LPESRSALARPYLELLHRRFTALASIAEGAPPGPLDLGLGARDRALARRVLRPLEARWHDGDENLVRGFLDRWTAPGTGAGETARRLIGAARELSAMGARPEAWWFFLWEMESVLPLVGE
jgi:hypothetical protein